MYSGIEFLRRVIMERRADAEAADSEQGSLCRPERVPRKSLVERLAAGRGCIVAEVKKASPSSGVLRGDYEPAAIAAGYERAGAAGISVLTEPRHFLGSNADLLAVRAAVSVPVLRKDFICHQRHVREAARLGADVVLLIVAGLDRNELRYLYFEAEQCGLETLAEIHEESELEAALELDNAIVGVNSRNLKTLKTDLNIARRIASGIPGGRLSIAESGIKSASEIKELSGLGYKGFLIGETFLREREPAMKLAEMLAESGV